MCVSLPVAHTKVRVGRLCHHQSATFGAVTREAKSAVSVGDLLDSQQHGRRLQGQQLTQTSDGGILSQNFLLWEKKTNREEERRLGWDYWDPVLA